MVPINGPFGLEGGAVSLLEFEEAVDKDLDFKNDVYDDSWEELDTNGWDLALEDGGSTADGEDKPGALGNLLGSSPSWYPNFGVDAVVEHGVIVADWVVSPVAAVLWAVLPEFAAVDDCLSEAPASSFETPHDKDWCELIFNALTLLTVRDKPSCDGDTISDLDKTGVKSSKIGAMDANAFLWWSEL